MADDKTKLASINVAKRGLIDRRKDIDEQVSRIKNELQQMGSSRSLEELNSVISQEVKMQGDIKREIDKIEQSIRSVRKGRRQFDYERKKYVAEIREWQSMAAEIRKGMSGEGVSKEQRAQGRLEIESIDAEVKSIRSQYAQKSELVSALDLTEQIHLGRREEQERNLSTSRRTQREAGHEYTKKEQAGRVERRSEAVDLAMTEYEERRRERMLGEADRMTPGGLRKRLTRAEPIDEEREGARARETIAGMGAGRVDQLKYQEATKEFSSFFNAIKETKEALANMTEGTDAYIEKQKTLIEQEGKAAETVKKMKDIEDRAAEAGQKRYRAQQVGAAFATVASGVSEGFSMMGERASQRYILEEQLKSAQVSVAGKQFRDFGQRGVSAEAFLMTGGGSVFGGESPYAGKGGVSGDIRALTDEAADARLAAKQIAQLAGVVANVPDSINKTMEAGRIGGPAAGGAAGALKALGIGKDLLTSPELMSVVHERARIEKTTLPEKVPQGYTLGPNVPVAGDYRDSARPRGTTEPIQSFLNNLPNLFQRAAESVGIEKRLQSTQMQSDQQERIRERYNAFLAPMLQTYMDVQPAHRQITRSRFMSQGERVSEAGHLDTFAADRGLAERGFGLEEKTSAELQAAQMLGQMGGRRRTGPLATGAYGEAMYQRTARAGLEVEAAGLGTAGQSIQAMAGMAKAGVQDPSEMMRKAVHDALISGIRDSREFQSLLEETAAVASNTMAFSGTMSTYLKAAGTGLPGEAKTISETFKTRGAEWSGATNTYTDMMKLQTSFKYANLAAQSGKGLGKKGKQNILSMIQFLGPEEMTEEYLKPRLEPEEWAALQPLLPNLVREKVMQEFSTSTAMQSQDVEFGAISRAIGAGEKDSVRKMLGTPDKIKSFLRTQLRYAGKAAGRSDSQALQETQWMANQIKELTGETVDLGELGLNRGIKSTEDEAAGALGQGVSTGTPGEAAAAAQAATDATRYGWTKKGKQYQGPFAGEYQKSLTQGIVDQYSDPFGRAQRDITKTQQDTMTTPTVKVPGGMDMPSLNTTIDKLSAKIDDLGKSINGSYDNVKKISIDAAGDLVVKAQKISGVAMEWVTKEVQQAAHKTSSGGETTKPGPGPGAPQG